MPKLLTMGEVADLLRRDRTTIYRWMQAGKFPKPSTKIVGSPYWDEETIKNFLKVSQTVASGVK